SLLTKTLLVMKFSAFFILVACLHANADGFAQRVSISEKNVSIKEVFKVIEKQTEYQFFYNERLLKQAKRINIELSNAPVEQVLEACFKDQPLTFAIIKNTIIVKLKDFPNGLAELPPAITVRGRVTTEGDVPVSNVSVVVKGSSQGTNTNANGEFVLNNVNENSTLLISSVGY